MDFHDLARRYVAVWNEPDPDARRAQLEALWTPDAVQYTQQNRFDGHSAIEARIADTYAQAVAGGDNRFQLVGKVSGHHGGVCFEVTLAPAAGVPAVWSQRIVLVLADDGRIRHDTHFGLGEADDTRAAVLEFLHRTVSGDPEQIGESYAESVDWSVFWPVEHHADVTWIRPRSSRAEVADHFRTFARICEGEVSLNDIRVVGNEALVKGVSSQTVRHTGKRFDMAFTLHLTVEDGLITRHHIYEDGPVVAAAFTD